MFYYIDLSCAGIFKWELAKASEFPKATWWAWSNIKTFLDFPWIMNVQLVKANWCEILCVNSSFINRVIAETAVTDTLNFGIITCNHNDQTPSIFLLWNQISSNTYEFRFWILVYFSIIHLMQVERDDQTGLKCQISLPNHW